MAAERDLLKQSRPIFSFDTYPEVSQAQEAGRKDMALQPAEARAIRDSLLTKWEVDNVACYSVDALEAPSWEHFGVGPDYEAAGGVGLLYIDDDHSGGRVIAELAAWEPLMADECEVCIHDFFHEPYGLQAAVDRWMVDHPEWVMVECQLSMARLRRRWRPVPRAPAVLKCIHPGRRATVTRNHVRRPTISVLYNTFRLGGLDCLKTSLDRQSAYAPPFEVVIVDALYDYRHEAVAAFFKDAPYRVKHVSVTDNPFPRDAGNLARNDAIRAADGDVCVWWCDYSLADADSLERHYQRVERSGFRANSCGHISYGEIDVEALHPDFMAALPFRTIDDYADFVETLPADSPLWITIFKGPPLEMARAGLIRAQHGHAQPYELRGKIQVSHGDPIGRDLRREFPNGPLPPYDFYYAKNEATARQVLIDVNGWEESFDDGHASDDMDMCRRLTLAGAAFVNDKGNECIVPNPRPFFPLLRWKRTPKENRALYDTLCAMNRPRAIQGLVNELENIRPVPMSMPEAASVP